MNTSQFHESKPTLFPWRIFPRVRLWVPTRCPPCTCSARSPRACEGVLDGCPAVHHRHNDPGAFFFSERRRPHLYKELADHPGAMAHRRSLAVHAPRDWIPQYHRFICGPRASQDQLTQHSGQIEANMSRPKPIVIALLLMLCSLVFFTQAQSCQFSIEWCCNSLLSSITSVDCNSQSCTLATSTCNSYLGLYSPDCMDCTYLSVTSASSCTNVPSYVKKLFADWLGSPHGYLTFSLRS